MPYGAGMSTLRTHDTRASALWGRNGGRARTLVVTLAVCAGLALASAPVAGAAGSKARPSHHATPTASWADSASWAD